MYVKVNFFQVYLMFYDIFQNDISALWKSIKNWFIGFFHILFDNFHFLLKLISFIERKTSRIQ